MCMKTYLTVMFSSEGVRPSEVVDRMHTLGFKPCHGAYDFEYDWDNKATIKDAIWLIDRIHAELEGMKVTFRTETLE